MRREQFILLVCLLFIGGTGGWLFGNNLAKVEAESMTPVPYSASSLTESDFAAVAKAAIDSCLCERDGGNRVACENIYSDARDALTTKAYGSDSVEIMSAWASACAPVSARGECFEFSDGEHCITTSYEVIAASSSFENRHVCTIGEARAIEQAFQQDGLTGLEDILVRIEAGAPLPPTDYAGGCTG